MTLLDLMSPAHQQYRRTQHLLSNYVVNQSATRCTFRSSFRFAWTHPFSTEFELSVLMRHAELHSLHEPHTNNLTTLAASSPLSPNRSANHITQHRILGTWRVQNMFHVHAKWQMARAVPQLYIYIERFILYIVAPRKNYVSNNNSGTYSVLCMFWPLDVGSSFGVVIIHKYNSKNVLELRNWKT